MEKEETAVVLDFLPHGYPLDRAPAHKKTAIVQALGKTRFALLELIPKKEIFLQPYEEVYIGEGKREITSDVKNNPNYFFNDYQREGDVYNKPNNIPNLHTHAIKEVMEKKLLMEEKYKVEINITNYNDKESIREFILTKPLSELFI